MLALVLMFLLNDLPETDRSRKAIERVRPELTRQLAELKVDWGTAVFLRLFKEEEVLELWVDTGERYVLFASYPICTFSGELGPKLREGDMQAPEGFYAVRPKRMNPASSYHLSFNVGYPNAYDRLSGRTGSLIMIHGSCVSTGCFAMTDAAIEEIYAMVDAGLRAGQETVPVHIFPFRMTPARLARERENHWAGFWANLKKGYDLFEEHGHPPRVLAVPGAYLFTALPQK